MAEARDLRALLPPRPFGSHKGNFGHLLVLAGSVGKTGAAAMSAEAALRAGAGLVTLGIPASLNDILAVKLTEAMTLPLPEATGARALGAAALAPIMEFLDQKSTLALGPGIGTHPETRELVGRLVHDLTGPMVIDADGSNNPAADTACLTGAAGPRILTPHPGEMARLLGLPPRKSRPGAWTWPGRPQPGPGSLWC